MVWIPKHRVGIRRSKLYHPDHARKSFGPNSALSLAKLNMKVYMRTVGSATPRISKGWPPTREWVIPQRAVDAKVWTAVKIPSAQISRFPKDQFWMHLRRMEMCQSEQQQGLLPVFLSNCSPKEMTGIAEAKNMYVVGARILKIRNESASSD